MFLTFWVYILAAFRFAFRVATRPQIARSYILTCFLFTHILEENFLLKLPPITYYWTSLLILDHSYLVGILTNSKIDETKALEPLKS